MLAGAVDEMEQDAAALHMAEEAVAEPDAFMGAGDEPRNIRQDELAAIDVETTPSWGCSVVKG